MQRPGTAEYHQREVARIVTAFNRQKPGAPRHVLVDDLVYAGGGAELAAAAL